MNEPDWTSCTEEELWKYVATHLAANGIDTTLLQVGLRNRQNRGKSL